MVTNYEADTDHWEDWQRDYRFGVLLIFPPDPPANRVNELRARLDPRSRSYCGAHISLTVPFPRPVCEIHWRELESITSVIKSFPVRYGPLKHYLPHPGVCLAIEPQAELDSLRAALEAASAFAGSPPRSHPFSAHMTIAEFISAEETETVMGELEQVAPTGIFVCTAVSYVVPDRDFRFTERRQLLLAR